MTFNNLKNVLLFSFIFSLNASAQLVTPEFYLKSDNGKREYNLTGKKLTVEFFGENKNPDLLNKTYVEGVILNKTDSSISFDLTHSNVRVYEGEKVLEQYIIYRNGEDNMIKMSVPLNKIDYVRVPYPKLESVDKFAKFLFFSGFIGLGSFGVISAIKNDNVPKYAAKGMGYSLISIGVGLSVGSMAFDGKKISFKKGAPWRIIQR